MTENQVLLAAIAKFGADKQMGMVVEEVGELLVALSHYARGRVPASAVVTEIADVEIMLEQLKLILSATDDVVLARAKKVERLRMRVFA